MPVRQASVVPPLLGVGFSLLLFAALAYGVRDGGTFGWDDDLVRFFDRHYYDLDAARAVTKAFVYAGMAGGAAFALVTSVVLLALRRLREALFWALAVGGAIVLAPLLKRVFERPQIGDPEGGYSFPSGNATASLAVAVALIILLPPSRLRRMLTAAAIALVPLYGLALVVLLWHYPSDVVAGWCIAVAWVTGLSLAVFARRAPRVAGTAPAV